MRGRRMGERDKDERSNAKGKGRSEEMESVGARGHARLHANPKTIMALTQGCGLYSIRWDGKAKGEHAQGVGERLRFI
eukprot:scaffold308_cov327-Pavlova_lutheri.AAC.10